jgi:hypothetical protein
VLKRLRNQPEYIKELIDIIEHQRELIDRYANTNHNFICGESNIKDTDNMPMYVYVCPSLGSDHVVCYEKAVKL